MAGKRAEESRERERVGGAATGRGWLDQMARGDDDAGMVCRPNEDSARLVECCDLPDVGGQARLADAGAAAEGERARSRRLMLVMVGVHSGQRSTSRSTAQTRSGGASISTATEELSISAGG